MKILHRPPTETSENRALPRNKASEKKKILLGPSDYDLLLLPLPLRGKREAEGFLAHRISVLYPWNTEEMAFDYRRQGNQALVYLIRKDRIGRFQKQGRSLFSVESALCRSAQSGTALIFDEGHVEKLRWENGRISEAKILPSEDAESLLVKETSSLQVYRRHREILPDELPAAKALSGIRLSRKKDRLFAPPRPPRIWTLLFLLPCLGFFLWSLFGVLGARAALSRENCEALQHQIDRIAAVREEAAALDLEIEGIRTRIEALEAQKSPPLSLFLSELSRIGMEYFLLENFTWQEGSFVLRGRSFAPLELKNRLSRREAFRELEIGQITPEEDGISQFTLSGGFHAP